ncbi:MAG: enoyl-CoA hydratase [Pseudomonadota bacterium]
MSENPFVLREDQPDGATWLWLNRPTQFNALSHEMLSAIQTELDDIAHDDKVRVVVMAAEGRAFCAGHDLKEMHTNRDKTFCHNLFEQCSHMMFSLQQLPQPVIARVQGIATAAGCQLVAACDLAVASEAATFATSGINAGLFCSTPAVPVSRNLSRKQAMEWLLTGEFVDAHKALQQGFINRVAVADELDLVVQKFTDSILQKSSVAVTMGKRMFYKQLEMGVEEAYEYATDVITQNFLADDAAEGIAAFVEKRSPVWRGR